MLRESFKKHLIGANKEFRHRGEEPGRLENFSDAVFALAITLLLISTSPPTNFEQIRRFVWELIPFTLCITVIISIWHGHFVFFYRYGLRHGGVILLNTIFLVIVLFYVYPLKFLTKMSLIPITRLFGEENIYQELSSLIRGQDWGDLMIIYGLGASGGFFVLMLMYRFALKKAKELDLNEIEVFDTKDSIRTYLLLGSVPLVSVLIAIILYDSVWAPAIAGPSYILYPIVMWIYGVRSERKRNKLLAGLTQAEPVFVHFGTEAEP